MSLTSPADNWKVVVPSDSADLGYTTKALRAESAGNIAMYQAGGGAVSQIMKFKAGETRPVRAYRILSTGTTVIAGDIEAAHD